jgi:radical SAM protein with 4Fe4S-binding SPASM domain
LDAGGYSEKKDLNQYPLFREKRPLLESLDIELTERCNNNCIHCYINRPHLDPEAFHRELTTDAWKNILSQAADIGVLVVRFTGGEPLIRPDFVELYLHARRLGMRVRLFTNARGITRELAALFSRIPPLEKIEVTVYGMQAETYEAVSRCPGSFDEFQQGVQYLLEAKVPFIVKGALLTHNTADRERFEEWAKTMPWMEKRPVYSLSFDMRGRRDSSQKNERISRLRADPDEILAALTKNGDGYKQEMQEFCSRFMGAPGPRLFSCGAGHHISIDAYGTVQPCLLLRMPQVCADLRTTTLRDLLTVFFPRVKEMTAANPDYLARCARCFIRGLCEQCPAKSWSEHGTLDTPVEYLCRTAHAQARYLGLIEPGELAWEVQNGDERIQRLSLERCPPPG